MPEGRNVGFPTSSPGRRKRSSAKARWEALVEIVEVAVLAPSAGTTASSVLAGPIRWRQQARDVLRSSLRRTAGLPFWPD